MIALIAMLIATPVVDVAERKPMPAVQLRDVEGKAVTLSGDVVVVAFWATWCKPCLRELPRLVELKDTKVVAVAVDGGAAAGAVRAMAKRLKLPIVVHDADGASVMARFAPGANVPTLIVVDKRGRIALRHEGYSEGDERALAQAIAKLRAE